MAANGISTLSTKEARQIAKLDLAATKRAADGNPRAEYDITLLPTRYDGNDVVNNLVDLVEGRPWLDGEPEPSYTIEFRSVTGDDLSNYTPGDIITTCNEGEVISFALYGTNIPEDENAYIQFSGANISSTDGQYPFEGNFTDPLPAIFSGNVPPPPVGPWAPILIEADNLTEGNETLTLSWVINGETVTSTSITIADTSVSPTYTLSSDGSVDEGGGLTFTASGTNVPNGEYYWTIETNSSDFTTTSGALGVDNNYGSFIVVPNVDTTTEGSETFTVALRSGSISGPILVTSDPVTINDTSTSAPLEEPMQLITNSDFTDGTNGWTAAGGFGTYSYTASNQVALYNGELYFTYVSRTVARNIDVSSVIANALSLKATVNIRHREKSDAGTYTQVDTYTFTVTYKNSSGATVLTKTTGLSNAPQNSTDINLILNRSEIPATFGTITTAAISVSAVDSGNWNGNHGPIVKYITLTAS